MSDPAHPTNPEWRYYDVCDSRDPRPPRGAELLILNPGGCMIKGHYTEDVRYWAFKPKVPKGPIPAEYALPMPVKRG